ncbi:hypothetical protein D3C78_1890070 [compost metagenome]
MLDHQIGIHRHHDMHLMQCVAGLEGSERHLGLTALGVQQSAFDFEQAVAAQIARAGDVACVQQLPGDRG